MLRGDGGTELEADADALLAAVSAGGRRPVAVALSACNTASPGDSNGTADGDPADPTDAAPLAAQLVARGIPVVSAMAGEIGESASRLYTRWLARAVHRGLPVVVASAHARRAALIGSTAPSTDIDWALPALFLGEYVDPYGALVDSTRADELTRGGGRAAAAPPAGLPRPHRHPRQRRRRPQRAGQPDRGRRGDGDGVEPGRRRQPTAAGDRLRALRDGHVPLLLGPYQGAGSAPTHARALVCAILEKVLATTEKLGVAPFVPRVLRDDLPRADDLALLAAVAEAEEASGARAAIRHRLREFRKDPGELIPDVVRDLLTDDLGELAGRVAARWVIRSATTPGCSCCAAMCTAGQRPRRPAWASCSRCWTTRRPVSAVPTVRPRSCSPPPAPRMTGRPSRTGARRPARGCAGTRWKTSLRTSWSSGTSGSCCTRGRTGWPRTRSCTARSTRPCAMRRRTGRQCCVSLGGRPTVVEDGLYVAANLAFMLRRLRRDDDELAWTSYVKNNPGYGL